MRKITVAILAAFAILSIAFIGLGSAGAIADPAVLSLPGYSPHVLSDLAMGLPGYSPHFLGEIASSLPGYSPH